MALSGETVQAFVSPPKTPRQPCPAFNFAHAGAQLPFPGSAQSAQTASAVSFAPIRGLVRFAWPASSFYLPVGQSQLESTSMYAVEDAQSELALTRPPKSVGVPIEMIRNRRNKGAAFTLACDASGLDDKEIYMALEMDKAQFSRIKSGTANLDDDLLSKFCAVVGNRIYPEWQAYQVGCTLVMIKTEAERIAEEAVKRADELAAENRLMRQLLAGKVAA